MYVILYSSGIICRRLFDTRVDALEYIKYYYHGENNPQFIVKEIV